MIRAHLCWLFVAFSLVLALPQTGRAQDTVDLNTATIHQLIELPGVGPKRALDIVRFRIQHGFRRPADLLRIRGIGRRTYFKLRPLLRVGPAVPRPVGAQRDKAATPQHMSPKVARK